MITGANRGIGEEIAVKFASEGNHLILLARKKFRLNNLIRKLKKKIK